MISFCIGLGLKGAECVFLYLYNLTYDTYVRRDLTSFPTFILYFFHFRAMSKSAFGQLDGVLCAQLVVNFWLSIKRISKASLNKLIR